MIAALEPPDRPSKVLGLWASFLDGPIESPGLAVPAACEIGFSLCGDI